LFVATIEKAHVADAFDALRCRVVLTDAYRAIVHADTVSEDNAGPVQECALSSAGTGPFTAAELNASIELAAKTRAIWAWSLWPFARARSIDLVIHRVLD
jgi:hypothetical protein